MKWKAGIMIAMMMLAACDKKIVKLPRRAFGTTPSGEQVDLFTLSNQNGVEASIITYGARIQSLKTPDRDGRSADITLGFDTLEGYLGPNPYFGAIVGRYANRIAKGKFPLSGNVYELARNNGENALHGGLKGFDRVVWSARDVSTSDRQALELTYVSKDGEEGYPGTLTVTVVYSVSSENELRIEYTATTDKDTVVNLSNHTYFNLSGEPDILNHVMMIDANEFTPVDATLIPTGELKNLDGTPFDFRKPTPIGARINANEMQIVLGGGYDHNFVLNHPNGASGLAARVNDPKSGRTMEILTTEPGVQFYTGNFLDGSLHGKGGAVYNKRSGFCLETQHFPDSPNHPSFPTTTLKASERFLSTTTLRFPAEKH
jgi:aldose 1-epimerase